MTRSEAGAELTRVVRALRSTQRRLAGWRGSVWLAALAALAASGWWAPLPWMGSPGSVLPMLGLGCAVCVAVVLGLSTARALRPSSFSAMAGEIERVAGLGVGELRGAMELGDRVAGSSELADLQRQRVSRSVSRLARGDLLPTTIERVRRARRAALPALGGALLLLAAGAIRPAGGTAGLASITRPWTVTFPPPPPPMTIESSGTRVLRGEHLAVRAVARGRSVVTFKWMVAGEPARRRDGEVDAGRATVRVGPIVANTSIWVEDPQGRASDTLTIAAVDPLMVVEMASQLSYPDYLRRPDEQLNGPPAMLTVPEGTRVRMSGRTNHPVRAARLRRQDDPVSPIEFRIDGEALVAEFEAVEGTYVWSLESREAVFGVRPPPDLELIVVPDEPPSVAVVYPADDLTLGAGRDLRLVVEARDDHGIEALGLVLWRESAAGLRRAPERVIGPADGTKGRVTWRPEIGLRERGVLPGDALVYFATAADANPRTAAVTSDTFRVRLATMSEARDAVARRTEHLAGEARDLKGAAERLAADAAVAEQRAAAASFTGTGEEESTADFASTEEARELLREARELERSLAETEERIRALRRDTDGLPRPDRGLRERLERLENLYREIRESGLGDRIAQLEQALRDLRGEDLRDALNSLSRDAKRAELDLERALGLMERVALEQSLEGAARRTADLAARQESSTTAVPRDEAWAMAERALAQEAEALQSELAELAGRLDESAAEAAAKTRQAAGRMSEASASMRAAAAAERRSAETPASSRPSDGNAASAAGALREAERRLEEAGESLARDWKEQALRAVDRATSEALDLAREQSELVESLRSGADPRDVAGRQSAIRQGLDNLTQELAEAGKRSALLDRRSGEAASRADEEMRALGRSLTGGQPTRAEMDRRGQAATEALGDLAGALVASRKAMSEATSGTGMEELLERLAEIGERQAGLNGETGDLFLAPLGVTANADRLAELAGRQAELSRQLRELAGRPEASGLPGSAEALARESDEIARRMLAGSLDREVVDRQEQLFRRLLDAGRTLERDEEDPRRRESLTARSVVGAEPGTARSDLPGGPRYPYPSEGDLAGLTAGQRRLVYEYFDRLNAGPASGARDR